jgi:histidinol-phosphate aminotransferase
MFTRRVFLGVLTAGLTEAAASAAAGQSLLTRISGQFSEAALAQRENFVTTSPHTVWLNANEYPDGPPPASIEAMTRTLRESNRYHYEEFESFYAKLAQSLRLDPSNILVGSGSSEVLHCAVDAFTNQTKPYITSWPSFEAGPELCAAKGVPVVKIPLKRDYSADVQSLAKAASDAGGGLIYVCNPNNPTSSLTPANDIRWLAEYLPPATYLLVDEAYIHFTASGERDSALNLIRSGKNVIVARTFSKIYGMAGLRVGFIVAQSELIKRMMPYRNNVISIIGVRAASAALDLGPTLIEERKARIAKARSGLIEWCRQKKINYIEPHANFMMIETGKDVRQVGAALMSRGVAAGRPFPPYDTMLRVTIGARKDMAQFQHSLSKVLGLD